MTPEEMYGPQWERVLFVLEEARGLSYDTAKTIGYARRFCDQKPLMSPWHAAEEIGRTRQVARARAHAVDALELSLINWRDITKRWTAGAIGDAVLAEATSDLLSTDDYIKLVTPWRIGWLDERQTA